MNLLCKVGLHKWQEYRSGNAGSTLVVRSWCPRCKADSILFGSYRHVDRNAWNNETPQEAMERWEAQESELRKMFAR